MAALIVSTSNLKLNHQSLVLLSSQTKPQITTSCIKSKSPISKHSFSKSLTSKIITPACKYKDLSNTLDEKISTKKMESTAIPVPESDSNTRRIWWSEVEVKWPKNNALVGRKWNFEDIETFSAWVVMHGLSLFAPFTFTWGAFWVAVALYVVTGMLGVCLSYHRHLSHKSFKLRHKWLEYFFAYCGVLAFQRDPIFWVSVHRHHHRYIDSEHDIHSPSAGFWYSHINWMFDSTTIKNKSGMPDNVRDLVKQPFYRFIRRTYVWHPILLGALLYAFGGFPYLVWGMGVRTMWFYNIIGLVNSASHIWGKQAWKTGDLSKNNWWVALLSFGEGWHNNHHAFAYSARHGLEWWQIDMTWYTIKLLERLGLATNVKLPTKDHKHRLALQSDQQLNKAYHNN